MTLTTVFFDFGGTLASPSKAVDRPEKVWVAAARRLGAHLSETLVRNALEATDEAMGPEIYQYLGRTPEFWTLYDGSVMDRLRIRENRETLARAVDEVFSDPSRVELFPETRPVLEDLKTRGFHLGLISNHNDGLLRILQYHHLDTLLDTVTYSQEVGAEKPAPQVFSKALERAQCAPSEAVHVGNSLLLDVEGARRSGLQAIWVNRENEPGPPDCVSIRTLKELPHILELMDHVTIPLR